MAVPTLTANSPSAGDIAWTAFHIQYNGIAYAVNAGNTADTYVYWLYNSGSPSTTLSVSNSQPSLTSDDLLLFLNKNGNPTNLQSAQLIDGDLIVNGTITGAQIEAATITASNIAAGTITSTQIYGASVIANIINGATITGNTVNAATFTGSVFQGTDFIVNSSGAFFYSGTPASGNLVLSAAQTSGTDAYGNAYKQGFTAYGPGTATSIWNDSSSYAGLIFHQTSSTSLTVAPQAFAVTTNTGAVNEYTQAEFTSGNESGHDDATLQLFSQPADASAPAKALIEFGGTVGLKVTKTGPQYPTPPVYHADCTTNLSITGSAADCLGANVTIAVHGNNSTVVVNGVFDAQTNASSGAYVIGVLNWAGTIQSENAVIQTGGASSMRATIAQTWTLTGVPAGSYNAKLGGYGTSGGTIRATHTTITVTVVEGM
jgi:hypothetical protein